MFHTFRKYRRSIIGTFMVGLCIILMVMFNADSYFQARENPELAKVNGESITYNDYARKYQQAEAYYRRQFGDKYESFSKFLNLKQTTFDSLVNDQLFSEFIDALNLTSSTSSIEEKIREYPFFEGGFSKARYSDFLRASGMTGGQLEHLVRRELVADQLTSLLTDIASPSTLELRRLYDEENTKIAVAYVEVDEKNFVDKVPAPSEEELQTFFQERAEQYQKPRSVRYSFIKFAPIDFHSAVQITDDELELRYRERSAEFLEPKKFHLRQIFIQADTANKEAKSPLEDLVTGEKDKQRDSAAESKADPKKEKAYSALERLDAGEKFALLAEQVSEDKETAARGGDLGWLEADAPKLEPALKEALSELTIEDHSQVIETEKGYYILYLEEVKDARQKSLEEVRPLVEAQIRTEDAPTYAREEAYNFFSKLSESSEQSVDVLAKEAGRKLVVGDKLLSAGQEPKDGAPGLTDRVLELEPDARELIELADNTFIVRVDEVKDSYVPELNEVRAQILSEYKEERGRALAREFVDKLRSSYVKVEGQAESSSATGNLQPQPVTKRLAELAKEHNLELKSSELVTRDKAMSGIFAAPGLKDAAFLLTTEKPTVNQAFQNGSQQIIIELKSRTPPSASEFDEKREELFRTERDRVKKRLLESLTETLRASARELEMEGFRKMMLTEGVG